MNPEGWIFYFLDLPKSIRDFQRIKSPSTIMIIIVRGEEEAAGGGFFFPFL
jgi:hypothetical protein